MFMMFLVVMDLLRNEKKKIKEEPKLLDTKEKIEENKDDKKE